MDAKEDRRRHFRWAVEEPTAGQITAVYEASLINISSGGALIEHLHLVRPGTTSFLTLLIHGQEVSLKCRVVRSVVHHLEVRPDGERDLIYRTVLEFLDPSEDSLRLIGEYIDSLRGER